MFKSGVACLSSSPVVHESVQSTDFVLFTGFQYVCRSPVIMSIKHLFLVVQGLLKSTEPCCLPVLRTSFTSHCVHTSQNYGTCVTYRTLQDIPLNVTFFFFSMRCSCDCRCDVCNPMPRIGINTLRVDAEGLNVIFCQQNYRHCG